MGAITRGKCIVCYFLIYIFVAVCLLWLLAPVILPVVAGVCFALGWITVGAIATISGLLILWRREGYFFLP